MVRVSEWTKPAAPYHNRVCRVCLWLGVWYVGGKVVGKKVGGFWVGERDGSCWWLSGKKRYQIRIHFKKRTM
ncbi:hypothetical protein E2C01_026820 [Portunus trituberculatus]|uniref:Uncharacterized protein n=1 Tax=Portunus trituberculatus TaxID=210409 RepID=A0A5B7EK04_PORTR|nr:hypothetical protein [Portunus trituberculatus]